MTTNDPRKAFFDFWAAQGEALIKVQEQATKVFSEGVKAASSSPKTTVGGAPDPLTAAADLGQATQALKELWAAATAMSGTLVKSFPPGADGDKTIETTLFKMFDPRGWMSGGTGEMDDVLGRMAEGPRFADLWEIERLYARVMAAWMDVRRRGVEHNTIILEAWVEAGRHFNDEHGGKAVADGQKPDPKAAMAVWTDTANKQLLETQRSEPFLKSQAATIRASTELRMAQQELVEHFGKQYGFPTRTELDDVHRTVTELRREVRALRRAQRGPAREPAPPASIEQTPH